jgi:two-component system cell cycle sensor histidine kinase/response regulator CckA
MMQPPQTVPTVLVVDDEAPIRDLARRILEENGYQVTEASDGLEAISILAQEPKVDLLMADLAMPKLRGDALVCQIRCAHPDLKVLYVTGQIDSLMDTRALWEDEAFLEKPFTTAGLAEAVSLLLYGTIRRSAPRGADRNPLR